MQKIETTINCKYDKLEDIYHKCVKDCENCTNDICDDKNCCKHNMLFSHDELYNEILTLKINVPDALKVFIDKVNNIIYIGKLFKNDITLLSDYIKTLEVSLNCLFLYYITCRYLCKKGNNAWHKQFDDIDFDNIKEPHMVFYSNFYDMKYTIKLIQNELNKCVCFICKTPSVFNFSQNCSMWLQSHLIVTIITKLCNDIIKATKPKSE